MTIGANLTASRTATPNKYVVPVSTAGNWIDALTALTTADNAGGEVLNAAGLLTTGQSTSHPVNTLGTVTSVQMRMKYDPNHTPSALTVQPFGFDANKSPERLLDVNGNHDLTFTVAASTDVQDGTWAYTASQEVDLNGAISFLAAIKTAVTQSGGSAATFQIRFK